MLKRLTLIEQFSSFILWNGNHFGQWRSEPRLQRSMSQRLMQHPTLTSNQWAIYWQNNWRDSTNKNLTTQIQQSRTHLFAYLQEPCHQAASDIWNTYQNYSKEYAVPDYFQFGVLRFDKLIAGFNPQLNSNLGGYAVHFLKWRMTDTLREIHKSWGYTNWGLLLYRSKTCIKNALIRYGISGTLLEDYLLAWECYVEIYKTAKQKQEGSIQEPTAENWLAISAAYNSISSIQKDANEIKKWVSDSGKAVSAYISLPSASINTRVGEGTHDIESFLNDESQTEESDLDFSEVIDYQEIHQKISIWLEEELNRLNLTKTHLHPKIKEILELYYRQGLKQTDIEKQLKVHQTTISRNLQKIKELLTRKFIEWSTDNLNISLKSTDIEVMSKVLEEWIRHYYKNTINTAKEI